MTLHPNWKAILTRAWSVRLMAAALVLDAIDVTLQGIVGTGMATLSLTVVSGGVNAAALGARFLVQANMPRDT